MLWFFIAGLTGRNSVNTKKTFNFHVLLRRDPFSTFGAFFQLLGHFVFFVFCPFFQLLVMFYRF